MSSPSSPSPKRGEVWLVCLDPTVGTEIRKTRPAIVISSDGVGKLPIKLVVPLTNWNPQFAANVWHVRIDPDANNGLSKSSAADVLQIRGVDTQRLVKCLGEVSAETMEEIVLAAAAVIEYP